MAIRVSFAENYNSLLSDSAREKKRIEQRAATAAAESFTKTNLISEKNYGREKV